MRYGFLAFLFFLTLPAFAQQTPITALPGANPLQANDLFPLDQRIGNTTTPSHVAASTLFNQGMSLAIGTTSTGLAYLTNGSVGLVNTTNAQTALNQLGTIPNGNGAYDIVPCTGSGDQSTLASMQATAQAAKTGMLVAGTSCVMNGQWQPPYNGYSALFGWGGVPTTQFTSTQGSGLGSYPAITVDTNSIATGAPGMTAIDTHGMVAFALNGINIWGNDSSAGASLISQSSQGNHFPNGNTLALFNSSLGQASTLIGCPTDRSGKCLIAGGIAKLTLTSGGTGYPANACITTYTTNPPFTGGSGTGATIDQLCTNGSGTVTFITQAHNQGTNYVVGDTLSVSNTNFGNQGSGLVLTVSQIGTAGGTYGSQNFLPHIVRSQFSQSNCAVCGSFSDMQFYDNEISGGNIGIENVGGGSGGGEQISNNRTEFIGTSIILGGPNSNGSGGGTFINNNLFTHNGASPDILLGQSNGYAIGNNIFDQAQGAGPSLKLGSVGSLSNVSITGDVWTHNFTNSLLYCIELASGFSLDYISMTGIACNPGDWGGSASPLIATVHYAQVPAHFVEDSIGPKGQHAEMGRPFGIGTSAPNVSMSLDLSNNPTKPLGLPVGGTSQRPGSPVTGMTYMDSTLGAPQVYTGSAWKPLVSSITPASLFGYFNGLILSNDATTPNTILDISAGSVTDDQQVITMALPAITKTTGSWAAGSGNGCLDTGSVAASAQYNVFVESTGTTNDVLCSTSFIAPLLSPGFFDKAYIGTFFTDGSSHIKTFKQVADTVYWSSGSINDLAAVTIGTTAALQTLSVPVGPKVAPLCNYSCSNTGNSCLLTSPDEPDQASGTTLSFTSNTFSQLDTTHTAGVLNSTCPPLITNTAAQIRARASAASTTLSEATRGWSYIRNQGPQILVLTSGSTVTLPPTWNTAENSIVAIGEGGNGSADAGGGPFGGAGGGGGAYAQINNFADAAGTSEAIQIGAGGSGTTTQFKNGSTLVAKNGANASGNTGGAGGSTGSSVGTIKFAGGAGTGGGGFSGSGGGGAGGPGGAGAAGGYGAGSSNGGAGGGGSNGGSAGNNGISGNGGAGGNNVAGSGGGAGGAAGITGVGGSNGGGGGGGGPTGGLGGAGGAYPLWQGLYGPGGGGGGGGAGSGSGVAVGGAGGLCGGGGGGGGRANGAGGSGGGGCIVLIWWPQ